MQERGTECREPGEWEEYYISGNVLKHSGKRPQTIRKNVLKHSGKCRQTFWGISPNIPEMSPIFLQSCQTSTMELFCENSQRPKYSAQHCLLSMLEKWKTAIDNRKMFGALLTGLLKAFDCLSHDLLIAKLNAYGFSIAALRLVQNYLSNRKQRTKINSDFSS